MSIMQIRWVFLLVCVRAWQNDYDGQLHFECPTGQSISRIQSEHENYYDDRVWEFSCSYKGELGRCEWFYNQNEYDGTLLFTCPNNGAIVATRSQHSSYYEDRRFSFKCCETKFSTSRCHFTGFVNSFDNKMDYSLPTNTFLHAVYSVHDNYYEDRQWKFEICYM